jgi:hypothetical protein
MTNRVFPHLALWAVVLTLLVDESTDLAPGRFVTHPF